MLQIQSLSGIERLSGLQVLSVAGTNIVTDSLLLLGQCSQLQSLDVSNTQHVHGDLALQYIKGRYLPPSTSHCSTA